MLFEHQRSSKIKKNDSTGKSCKFEMWWQWGNDDKNHTTAITLLRYCFCVGYHGAKGIP